MPNDLNTNLALLLNGLGATPSGSVPVRLSTQSSAAGVANSGVAETDLFTYSLPANALNGNNQSVRITAWGTLAVSANTKTIKVYFGATAFLTIANATSGGSWRAQAEVIRTGASAQVTNGVLFEGGLTAMTNSTSTAAIDLTSAATIKVTGQSSAASSDVLANGMIVEWLP